MAGAKAALQHLLDRARQPEFGRAPHLLGGERGRGGADRFAGARQQVAARIDDGDVLRPQARHGGGDEVEDRLDALAVQPADACHGQHHAGLRVLAIARERLAARQHEMHAHAADTLHGADGAGDLALQRAGLVDLLLELGGDEAVGTIEDLVADRAAGGQTLAGQRHACLGHLIGRYQDLAAVGGDTIGDVAAGELIDHLGGIAQVKVTIEQGHRLGAAAQCHKRQHPEHAESDGAHRGEPGQDPRLAALPRGPSSLSPLRPQGGVFRRGKVTRCAYPAVNGAADCAGWERSTTRRGRTATLLHVPTNGLQHCRNTGRTRGAAGMKSSHMTTYIVISMVLGIAVGGLIHNEFADPATQKLFATYISFGSVIFLRLIKMIIAPLVFSTLVVGIGHMSDAGAVGRVGGKAMLWFVSASLVSLGLGLVLVNLFEPGVGIHKVASGVSSGIDAHAMTLDGFVKHVFPDSAIRPMVDNEILQIVVFSIFFGVACAAMGERARLVLEGIEGLSHIILRVTGYVMKLAPLAVFCAMAATISTNGLGILVNYAKFMGEFYFGLACLWVVLIVVGFIFLGPSVRRLILLVREPFLLAFSTASSEAAYPKMLEQLAKFPISRNISSFILPLGYSFNLDGTMMYCTFASVFIAQAYDIPLSLGTQLAMLLTLMLTSKGVAGVPRASLVVIAATLNQFSLPDEGLLLILGIDTFLDMGRSATNVIGNSLATAVVAKWEGQLISDVDTMEMIEEMEVEPI